MMNKLQVEVIGREIVVTMPGARFMVYQHHLRRHASLQRLTARGTIWEHQSCSTIFSFACGKLANDWARESLTESWRMEGQ
jgi:hypothetical protein